MMHIWIDADACPVVIKEILCRAAMRKKIAITFIANQTVNVPRSPFIKTVRVSQGFDVADDEIVKRVVAGDLVITSDIPLASDVIEKGGFVLTSRGEQYTLDNIKNRLSMRDFMESMRSSGVQTGGPPPMNQADRQQFANQLDRFLAKA